MIRKSRTWFWLFLTVAVAVAAVAVYRVEASPSNTDTGPLNQSISPQGLYAAGGESIYGSIKQVALGKPTAPTVVGSGTAGTTSYIYYCVAQDMNGNETIPSASFTFTTGNATLSATNFNTVTCPGQAGALGYRVLKADTSHSLGVCSSNSLINGGSATGTGCSVVDNTTGAGAAYTAQTIDQTGPGGGGTGANGSYDFTQTVSPCAAPTVVGGVCTNPTVTLPAVFGAAYTIVCTCVGTVSGVPVVEEVVKTAPTTTSSPTAGSLTSPGVNVVIGALTVTAAKCFEIDCHASLAGSTGN